MMDFAGVHKWVAMLGLVGNIGKVNILYLDGTVESGIPPMSLRNGLDRQVSKDEFILDNSSSYLYIYQKSLNMF